MLPYILKVTICWAVFYSLYALLLRKETFFHINRWYLLGTLLLGLVIPFIQWQPSPVIEEHPTYEIAIEPIQYRVQQFQYAVQTQQPVLESNTFSVNWRQVIFAIYLIGVVAFTARFGYGLWKIWQLYRSSEVVQQGKIKVVYTPTPHLPFSFFNLLFWSKTFEAKLNEKVQILRHEEAHIKQWHTLDVLLMEVLNILFWCSPMIYLYRNSLRTVHEYLADALVLQTTHRKQYGRLLLKQSMSGLQIALANHFINSSLFNSELKNRILMMTRNKSSKRALMRYLFFAPILLLAILVFSSRSGRSQVEEVITGVTNLDGFDERAIEKRLIELAEIYNNFGCCQANPKSPHEDFSTDYTTLLFDQFPEQQNRIAEMTERIFPKYDIPTSLQYEHGTGRVETIQFSKKDNKGVNMLNYEVYLNYKEQGKAHFDKSTLASQFEIELIGFLKYQINRSNTPSELQENFDTEVERWVTLHPNRKEEIEEISKSVWESGNTANCLTVDEHPRFIGCEELANVDERNNCSFKNLLTHVYSNIRYPADARKKGVEGICVAKFTVNTDGSVSKIRLIKDIGGSCGDELIRVIELMNEGAPSWVPAKTDGKATTFQYTLPVRFQFQDSPNLEMEELLTSGELDKNLLPLSVVTSYGMENSNDSGMTKDRFKGILEPYILQFKAGSTLSIKQNAIIAFDKRFNELQQQSPDDTQALVEIAKELFQTYQAPFDVSTTGATNDGRFKAIITSKNPDKYSVNYTGRTQAPHDFFSYDDRLLYIVDGKTVDKEAFNKVLEQHDRFESVKMLTAEAAREKYGEKGKYGAIEYELYESDKKQLSDPPLLNLPLQNMNVVQKRLAFGKIALNDKNHFGIDYAIPMNTPVISSGEGIVKKVTNDPIGYGKHIVIDHGDGYETVYAHLNEMKVEVGQKVKQRDVIGLSGNSGKSTGPHLHFAVRKDGKYIDPVSVIDGC